ncbi:MAG TPA: MBL fold metallo-hydrolase, partial [Roseiarcus sp.]
MRIHHLNCGSLCPRGGKLFGGSGGPLSPAPMCCHCLLIEGDDGMILVDSGLGVEDVNEPRRLGFLFNAMLRPRLDVAETALRQVADLGFRPSDVRHIVPTHLDLDHAGGIADFPDAAVHIFADELRAASHRSTIGERNRYRKVQIAAVRKW